MFTHAHMHTYTDAHTHTYSIYCLHRNIYSLNLLPHNKYQHTHTHTQTRTHTHTHTHTYTNIMQCALKTDTDTILLSLSPTTQIHAHACTRTHTCTHTHTHTHTQTREIMKSAATVLAALLYLVLPWQRLNARDLAAHTVPAPGGSHMDLCMVLQPLEHT